MTSTPGEPGERRARLDRPPGDRYATARVAGDADAAPFRPGVAATGAAIVLVTAIAYTVLGGMLEVTAGLIAFAAVAGLVTGRLVSPPARAALVGFGAVLLGFLGIWLFGRIEGGVLDPIEYLLEVDGPIVVALSLLAGGGLAAAAAR